MGWVKVDARSNMQYIVDFSVHTFKKSGFELTGQHAGTTGVTF